MATVRDFIFVGSKITQMVTAAIKLKDSCSLEEKLWHHFADKGLSSQSYSFSSSQVPVWELDHKEGWALKKWYFLFFSLIYFIWRLITLQNCGGFCHTFTWISHVCTCVPHPDPPSHFSPHPIPHGHPSAPALSTLPHASNLDWRSISHVIIFMCQCYSLKSSHPRLLPQSPKVCSLHLCLFCCLTYRVIITIFLISIYMCQYTVLVFFFLAYFTLYNRLQFHPSH